MNRAVEVGARTDVVLVGAGIMSVTLAILLRELAPELEMVAFERLDGVALESTDAMNNAGTGHAAYCELNYSPQRSDGSIDISKAVAINASFEESLSLWAYLVERGALPEPGRFIAAVPHLSLVWGDADVAFLRARHACLAAHPFFDRMQYTEDRARIAEWAPLVMEGRQPDHPIAATRMARGSDIDFGALTRLLFDHLERQGHFALHFRHEVTNLVRTQDGRWAVTVRDRSSGERRDIEARFVFLGAGGGALPLLTRSGIPEGRGYGGFPVSGQWLVCSNPDVVARHETKVYGKASLGAPPMSVPHLDTRLIDGRKGLLFGPFAGFSTKFLKTGSYLDLPLSLRPGNVWPMTAAGLHNVALTRYLIGQVLQSPADRLAALRSFMPTARAEDWSLAVAGQRVQIIKPDPGHGGKLEFGTEVVAAADGSLAALLGASPGASTAATTMVALIARCFPDRARRPEWAAAVQRMIPSSGRSLEADADLRARARAQNNEALGLVD